MKTLTERQRQILELLAEGNTAKVTAQALGLSPGTVRQYACDIITRLDARNITHAAVMWARGEIGR